MIDNENVDHEFSIKCEGYAITCYLWLTDQLRKSTETTSINENEDDDEKDSEDDTAELIGGFKGGTSVIKRLPRLAKAKRAPQEQVGIEDDDHREDLATEDAITLQEQEVIARKPTFEERLILVTDESTTTRYSSAVYPWNAKMLTALGVDPYDCVSTSFSSEDTAVLCDKALEYLLKQTEDCRDKYALECEELLVEELDSHFTTMKSLFDSELHTTVKE